MVSEPSEKSMQSNVSCRPGYLFAAKTAMIAGTVGSFILLVISLVALQGIYQYYPQLVAQRWFIFDEAFAIFTFLGVLFGLLSSLTSSRTDLTVALIAGVLSTASGAGVFVTSLIAPLAVLWRSIVFYFMPLFVAPLAGTLLIYYVRLKECPLVRARRVMD